MLMDGDGKGMVTIDEEDAAAAIIVG